MNTKTKIFAGIAAVAILLSSTGAVFASTADVVTMGAGFGRGNGEDQDGLLEPYMESAVAEGLGLTVEELDALVADGETHLTIALAQGITVEEFNILLENARETALAMAAEDGIVVNQFGRSNAVSGQFGTRSMDPENCNVGTCSAQQSLGAGMRRGGRR